MRAGRPKGTSDSDSAVASVRVATATATTLQSITATAGATRGCSRRQWREKGSGTLQAIIALCGTVAAPARSSRRTLIYCLLRALALASKYINALMQRKRCTLYSCNKSS